MTNSDAVTAAVGLFWLALLSVPFTWLVNKVAGPDLYDVGDLGIAVKDSSKRKLLLTIEKVEHAEVLALPVLLVRSLFSGSQGRRAGDRLLWRVVVVSCRDGRWLWLTPDDPDALAKAINAAVARCLQLT